MKKRIFLLICFFLFALFLGKVISPDSVYAYCDGWSKCGTTETIKPDPLDPSSWYDSCNTEGSISSGCWVVNYTCGTYACSDCIDFHCGEAPPEPTTAPVATNTPGPTPTSGCSCPSGYGIWCSASGCGSCISGTGTCDPDTDSCCCCPDDTSCFPPGTKVLMSNGEERDIEDVEVGDSVLSYDEEKGMSAVAQVLELESPVRGHLCQLSFADNSFLKLTNEHPVWTDEGWKSINPEATYEEGGLIVGELEVGDDVIGYGGYGGKEKEIAEISCQSGIFQTYNLKKISKTHTFYADGVLVHNSKEPTPTNTPTPTPACVGCSCYLLDDSRSSFECGESFGDWTFEEYAGTSSETVERSDEQAHEDECPLIEDLHSLKVDYKGISTYYTAYTRLGSGPSASQQVHFWGWYKVTENYEDEDTEPAELEICIQHRKKDEDDALEFLGEDCFPLSSEVGEWKEFDVVSPSMSSEKEDQITFEFVASGKSTDNHLVYYVDHLCAKYEDIPIIPTPTPYIIIEARDSDNQPVEVRGMSFTYQGSAGYSVYFTTPLEYVSDFTGYARGGVDGGGGIVLKEGQEIVGITPAPAGGSEDIKDNDCTGDSCTWYNTLYWHNYWWPSYPYTGFNKLTYIICVDTSPSSPSLVSPADEAVFDSLPTSLSWNAPSSWGACCSGQDNHYLVYLDDDDNFLSPLVVDGVSTTSTSHSLSDSVELGKTYYWKIVADNGCLETSSLVWSFCINEAPQVATHLSDGTFQVNQNIPLFWANISDWGLNCAGNNNQYQVYYCKAGTSGCTSTEVPETNRCLPVGSETTGYSSCTISDSLDWDSTYYWKVVTDNGALTNAAYSLFKITYADSWFQAWGGDVYGYSGISSPIPDSVPSASKFFSLSLDSYSGLISSPNSRGFGEGKATQSNENDWSVGGTAQAVISQYSYSYFAHQADTACQDGEGTNNSFNPDVDCLYDVTSINQFPLDLGTGKQIFVYNVDENYNTVTITDPGSDWAIGDNKVLVFVNFSASAVDPVLVINPKITVGSSGFFALITNGDIEIKQGVDNVASIDSQLQGVYVADGQIRTNTDTTKFIGEGIFYAKNGFDLNRDLKAGNATNPAEFFIFNPQYLFTAPQVFREKPYLWRELVP